ncbi:MAG: carbohydrate ABC transporter permease [Lachnospiraceae bacterium]|nr:carbohydrate ABC transporter permease [Lachnospiraceae bacterium]
MSKSLKKQDRAADTEPTTAKVIIKPTFSKEKLHRFIFGTREKQGVGKMIVIYALLICIGFVYLYPMLYMISTSFMSRDDLLDTSVRWLPGSFYLQNYKDAAKSMDFFMSLLKGVVIAGLPTLCNIIVCMFVGYGFARYDFKGKKIMMGLLIFSYILPSQVTMIPTYVLYNNMGILGTILTFVLPALFGNGLNAPIFILIFYQFFRQIPKVLTEAAAIDGAGHFRTFFKIAVPSAVPAIVTVVLFSFVWYWNESYLTELYVRGISAKSIWTNLVVQLKNFDQSFNTRATVGDTATSLNESVRMAATSISILPLLIMYLVLQRQFVESIDRAGITGE